MQTNIRFKNRSEHELSGVIHHADATKYAEPIAYALYAHCFTCTKSIKAAVTIASSLAQQGIATLRFDFTGLGGSKGAFADSNFSTNIDDLVDAAEFMASQFQAPKLLVGHSLGGTAMLAAAQYIESAKAVASIGSPANPEHILHLLEQHLLELEQHGQAEVKLAGRPFTFKQAFVDDVQHHSINYRDLRKAVMVMHSPIDETVSVDEAAKIFTAAMHPKSFISLDQADHLLSRTEDAQYAADALLAWAKPYLDLADPQSKGSGDQPTGVIVDAATEQGFLCRMQAGGHYLVADEPLAMGGGDLGPSPYDYLSAALGSCTAMTLNMYARHKKMALEHVSVDVSHERVHAQDCTDCESQQGKIDVLTRKIGLSGNLTEQERARLLQIADRCPVHRTLEQEVKIRSELA